PDADRSVRRDPLAGVARPERGQRPGDPVHRLEGDLLPQDLGGRRAGHARVGLGAPGPGGTGAGAGSTAVWPGWQAEAPDAVTRADHSPPQDRRITRSRAAGP